MPGAVLSVRRHDRVICEHAFGRRRVDQDALLEVDDLFSVASLTKPIVAAGVLQLCEAGLLELDDEVGKYLPEFAEPRVLTSYDMATGAIEARAARTPVTIRHLLAHTSGIHHGFVTDDSVMGTLYDRAGVVHDAWLPLEENVRRLGPLPLTHEHEAAAYASGGGGLFTTVQDYARFVQALLDGGRPILGQVSVWNMTNNQIGSLNALGLKYGLGLGLATPDAPGRSPLPVGGFGWYGIFSTWFWALPDRRAIVLLFGNVLEADMNLPLFSGVVDAIERDLAAADPLIVGGTA